MKNIAVHSVKIGELDRLVQLQIASAATNDYHGETLAWSDLTDGQVWAKVMWAGGGENDVAEKKTATSRVVFTIRYRADAKAKRLRIVHESQNFDVVNVREIGRQAFLELEAKLFE